MFGIERHHVFAREVSSMCRRACRTPRQGGIRRTLAIALVIVAGAAGGGWYWTRGGMSSGPADAPLTAPVVMAPFVHEVVERGEVESSSNVEVRCEVQSRNSWGAAILEIVPEGKFVQPGDFLIRLDDSMLQAELTQQQIVCNTSQAEMIQAQAAVATARLTKKEYESGTFHQEEEQLQSEHFVAEENLRRAEEYLNYSERLASKGYVTATQLEADRFAVEKARKELDVVRIKLEVLKTFTRQKMLSQFEADIQTAEAKLSAVQDSYNLDQTKLEFIKTQIAKCQIRAPSAGQVVYANDTSRSSSGDVLIEEGKLVRERQVLIRLPNPHKMQVLAKINESRIDLIDVGHTAVFKLDALPGVELHGIVRKVSEYPLPTTSSFTAHVKDYATVIEIQDPPEGLRPGMTAQVAIEVERLAEAVQAPVQAVFERDGRHFCLVAGAEGDVEPREVLIGSNNEKFVIVRAGLTSDEQVVLSPSPLLEGLALPAPNLALNAQYIAQQQKAHTARKPVVAVSAGHVEPQHADAGGGG